jgi:hypothetical protein
MWKGKPLDHYPAKGGMTVSQRCQICDLAWEMRLSEGEFYRQYDPYERAQLLATYRSRLRRDYVIIEYPAREM